MTGIRILFLSLNTNRFGEYHFKANVYHQEMSVGKCDIYMIRDLPSINKMSVFDYNFEYQAMNLIMKKSDNGSFTINEIVSVEKKVADKIKGCLYE